MDLHLQHARAQTRRQFLKHTGLGAIAHRIRTRDLAAVYDLAGRRSVTIGQLSQAESISACIAIDDTLNRHFAVLAEETARPILVYNIPYRTGVNMSNETLLRLAELPNIVGVKDCCADAAQSFDLMRVKPAGFSVMTGEDAWFYTALTQGADGGILASAHIETARFAAIRDMLIAGDQAGALRAWRLLTDLPRLLFAEPSPAPIKHWLWRIGLIDSPEVRLPMTQVSDALAARIEHAMEQRRLAA